MREGLNNRFKGGWENLFFVMESLGSSTVKAVYIKLFHLSFIVICLSSETLSPIRVTQGMK